MHNLSPISFKLVVPLNEYTDTFKKYISDLTAHIRELRGLDATVLDKGVELSYTGPWTDSIAFAFKKHFSKETIKHMREVSTHCHKIRADDLELNGKHTGIETRLQQLDEYVVTETFFPILATFLEDREELQKRLIDLIPQHVVLQQAVELGRFSEVTDKSTFIFRDASCSFGTYLAALPVRQEHALRAQLNRIHRNMKTIRDLEKQNTALVLGFGMPGYKF